ncbi:potassium channel family protein [Streptomyces sp. LX-29]|uniref:potassium channel family protein n=1 Tax=Streptomyces sp. LX-29 TaxID=2900152 RepID=UPI00240CED3C|nr:potassium channel family protein [Streptomyces sp. LX-29]WFB08577.1 potassium channel family protein [Streptomyces sp. LX-29]
MVSSFFGLLMGRLLGSGWWRRFHVRAALWGTAVTVLVLLGGSALIVPAEENAPDASITSFPRAVWWAIETATTVGYGDLYPVTALGRVIATVVMLAGITTFSVVTAAVATWFVGRAAHDMHHLGATLHDFTQEREQALAREMRAVHDRFDHIERLLRDRQQR